jgi:hypothetical protein
MPRAPFWAHPLESRTFLSASNPSGAEQEIYWLINRMRTNPAAELPNLLNSTDPQVQRALSFFQVDRDLLAQQWSTLTPVQPLAWSANLAAAAAAHTQAMIINDQQGHIMPGEAAPNTRINNAGYQFTTAGENVYAFAYGPEHCDAAFAVDWGSGDGTTGGIQDPPDHRIEMMNGAYRDVGVSFMPQTTTRPDGSITMTGPYLCTEDFAAPDPALPPAVVGTVYYDINHDGAYNAGEGLGGVTITATGTAGTFTATSRSAGGYALTLPAGDYTLTFSGTDAIPPADTGNAFTLHLAGQNILQDLETSTLQPPAGNTPPIGKIDGVVNYPLPAGPRSIVGWAYDADAPNGGADPVMVRLDVDGTQGTPVAAADPRPDLAASLPSTNHGFTLTVPLLTPGVHTLKVVMLDAPGGGETLLGTRTVTVSGVPFGYVDNFSLAKGISGWAYDADVAAGPATIAVNVDGKIVSILQAATTRNDLTPAVGSSGHGFSLALPQTATPGPHRYDVYVINANGPGAVLLASKTLTFSTTPFGTLEVVNPGIVTGWAADTDSLPDPARLVLLADGKAVRALSTNVVRSDLKVLGDAPHGFVTLTPALPPGFHTIALYAIDDKTNAPVLLSIKGLYIPPTLDRQPLGSAENISETSISGWAVDPDVTSPVVIVVTADDTPLTAAYASTGRQDLVNLTGSANHGFSITLSANALSAGTHLLKVFALNAQTGAQVLLGSKFITVAAPPAPPDPDPPPVVDPPPVDPTPTDPPPTDPSTP